MIKGSCYRKEKLDVVVYRKSNDCLIGVPSFSFIRIFSIKMLRLEITKFENIL